MEKQDNPKLKQFLEELNELQERYQYSLQPIISVNQGGILPSIKIVDKIPPKKPVLDMPEEPASEPEKPLETAEPESPGETPAEEAQVLEAK